ncbi:MAG TPA: hypothetical protein ENN12_03115 [Epsilonproteobacteria bacterium]|nr:hypothetical protein [Campylobacterota bacterium]
MKIGLYLFASFSMMIIVGILTYIVNPNHFSVSFLGINVTLAVALWVMLPLAILIFFSALHILFYGTKNFLKLRKWRKDMDELQENLYWSILQQPRESSYSLSEMQETANILGHSHIIVDDSELKITNAKLLQAVEITRDINNGKYVDLKDKKIKKALSIDNKLLVQNQINRLNQEPKFISTVLQDKQSYSESVVLRALELLATTSTFVEAEKYLPHLSMSHFDTMIMRVNNGEDLGLTPSVAKRYIKALVFGCQDFVRLAACVLKQWRPEEALEFFNTLQQNDEKAESAYLYLLFAYEMMNDIRDFFDANPENEFKKYKMFYTLKQTQSGHKIEDLIDINTLCDHA